MIWKKSEPKVFNWSELHLSEVTSYKILTLIALLSDSKRAEVFGMRVDLRQLFRIMNRQRHLFIRDSK